MTLTATNVAAAKAKEKEYRLFDSLGLYLAVSPVGGKSWRFKYRVAGKEKKYTIGKYPEVTLAQARVQRDQLRASLAKGVDPGDAKRAEKLTASAAQANSFGALAEQWFTKKIAGQSQAHAKRTLSILNNHLLPILKRRLLTEITPPDLLAVLRVIESKGAIDTAHRAKQIAGQIFRFAIASGSAERDPSADLRGALETPQKRHFAALTEPEAVGKLMLAIDNYTGFPVVSAALKISPLLLARPGEIRHMEWSEIDTTKKIWSLPSVKMKMRADHIVPLSRQSLIILEHIHDYTGRGKYVFPSPRGQSRPMSENAVRVALRALGYTNEQMTSHGFRAMARTLLDEALNYRIDYIEQQLAHAVKDTTGRAYNRTKHLQQRAEMMQVWADYLDDLRAAAAEPNVVAAKFR